VSAVIAENTSSRQSLPLSASVLRRRTRMRMEFIEVDGVRLRVGIRRGRGRPMLLFNGIGADLAMTLPLVNALEDVEVIVFDIPGSGDSPALSLPHRFRWLARLAAHLLDRLGYDSPVNVAGVSWGGALAQQFALDFSERTNRLILAATSTGLLALPARSNALTRMTHMRRLQKKETLAQLAPTIYGGLVRRRPELLDRKGHSPPETSRRGYLNQLLAGVGWTSVHRLYRLRCPTLIMGGDDDPVMPLINTRLLYWLIPKSYLHIVRGGGHLFLLVRANESAAVIKRFLSERRYDGSDEQDYYAAHNLPADGALRPLTAASSSAAP